MSAKSDNRMGRALIAALAAAFAVMAAGCATNAHGESAPIASDQVLLQVDR
ncbi:hypothetical protein MSIMFI_04201 [Mycobacterium simulans]|uniref:hypothetical protein n=1 Tax=Mycobacterium simulans TaxID=627089 RepID=UPI00174DF8F1|nr:hypothetical protein [Mycobacterium simulans]SON62674.1 hypothetical protein MSIMFI_04201 [Mycobacterium simulans]